MIFALLKGIIAGLIGSLIASLLVNKVTSSKGGALNIHLVSIADHQIYWSWLLFIVLGAFATALFKMMD
jgi:fructose-specific phosphotransferase system IIC component